MRTGIGGENFGRTREDVARYWLCMRRGTGGEIFGLTGGGRGKILEMYENRDWIGEIMNYEMEELVKYLGCTRTMIGGFYWDESAKKCLDIGSV